MLKNSRPLTRWLVVSAIGLGALAVAYKGRRRIRTLVAKVEHKIDPSLGNTGGSAVEGTAQAAQPPPKGPWKPSRPKTPLKVVEKVFEGGLKTDWQDYGWATREVKGPGPAKLKMKDNAGWIIARPTWESPRLGGLVFRIKFPSSYGQFLEVMLQAEGNEDFPIVYVTNAHAAELPDGWAEIFVPMKQLNPMGMGFDRIRLRAQADVGNDWVLLDGIGFTEPSNEIEAAPVFPARSVAMKVSCKAPSQKISPFIYGVAYAEDAPDMGATTHRWGGNRASRYNWELGNATNTGNDFFFRNVLEQTVTSFIDTVVARKRIATVTVPMIGWVAKDTTSYSFPVSIFGAQKAFDWGQQDSGNGEKKDGTKITPGPPDRTSVVSTPESIGRFVKSLKAADDRRGARTIREYILDNEPVLWNQTHRDVHPQPLSYDELLDRSIRYGTEVRKADPGAIISGPAEWGWDGYWWSAKDGAAGLKNKPDRLAHGDVPLLDWYLTKMREAEQQSGVHILDVVDLHFYPEGQGVKPPGQSDPATAALRLRQTRGLWDPNYKDESWINEKIRLIPRMKEVIAKNFPGRGISFGEWNFGGEAHMSGGMSVAEALGRFAEGGVTSAYYWTAPKKGMPSYWGFRAYRNFDGKGGHFLEMYVPATAGDGASFFASRDESGKHIVAVAINMDREKAADAVVDLGECGSVASYRAYRYWGQGQGLTPNAQGGAGAKVVESLPPWSIAVFDITLTK